MGQRFQDIWRDLRSVREFAYREYVAHPGGGYWAHIPSAGQTVYLTADKATAVSAYEMYEFHGTQKHTDIRPGQTLNIDYSITQMLLLTRDRGTLLQIGLAGYGQYQTTDHRGVTAVAARTHYMLPTILAIAGDDKVTEKCLNGYKVGNMTYKVHLDGHNLIPYLTGQTQESPRQSLVYFGDDGEVAAVRVGDYKFHLALQRANTMRLWAEPFVKVRIPYIMNLRRDPFERAEYNSNTYLDWMVDHVPQMYLMQAVVAGEVENFRKFPPRQKPASFNLDEVMRQVSTHTHA